MTTKELRLYRLICGEIQQRTARLERDRRHVTDAVQSAADFPYSKHTVVVEGDIYPYPARPEFDRLAVLRATKKNVERFVDAIDDYRIKRIIEIRYIEPCHERITWEKVADILNDGSTGNSLKIEISRYLKKTKK